MKENIPKEIKKENIKSMMIAALIIIFAFAATYAYFELFASNNSMTGEGGCFEVNYNGTEITNASLQSGTTYESGKYSTITLSKNANCDIYSTAGIYLHTNTESTAPLGEAFKYIVLNGQTIVAEGFIDENEKLLTTVTLTTTATDYTIYLWIDASLSAGSYNGTTYSGYLYAASTNESDVKPPITANAPNLDNNNLIPVYYDNTNEVWKKADSTNANNSWYDYDNKEWANAVLIKDDTARATYQSATTGTTITESDISGFLVWIPRYKYRVWNITRQGGTEDTYAYPAYTNGIDIEWEQGTVSTGNVECDYNVENSNPSTTLSDVCVYNDTTTITPESGNTNFTDAWYTHPAFTFNGSNKTGFWIGKFETTGTAESPTVLPDTTSLVNQTVSTQFTTSKVFQTYGLSSSVNAHMLTNLEWGAMAYLTHSIYGLCDGTICRDAYINNSSEKYTGRSAGVLAPSSSSSTYGAYNYKGYPIDSSTGSSTGTKNTSLVASSTGNITGVYDISGGADEYVMANQVDSSNNFNPSSAGDSWNGLSTPNTFYYKPYSYGDTYEDQTAFNRSYLGDATAETTGGHGNYEDAWQPGTGITGSISNFVGPDYPWFIRGGYYYSTKSGSFNFGVGYGFGFSIDSFRLSVS